MRQVLVVAFAIALLSLPACSDQVDPENSSKSVSTPTQETARCEPVAPRILPSGAPTGAAQEIGQRTVAWGADQDRVVQRIGGSPLGDLTDWPQSVTLRDTEALVVPIGDPGQIAFVFTMNDCSYTTWIGPGITLRAARQYASSY